MTSFASITPCFAPVSGVMFADITGTVIFLVVAGASAFFQWLKNKGQDKDWTQQQMPRPPGNPPPANRPRSSSNWEEELRRMLETNNPNAPRPTAPPVIPPRAQPPPIPRTPPPRPQSPVPSVPTMSVPKVFVQPKVYKAHCDNCGGHIEFPSNMLGTSIVCPHCLKRTVLEPFIPTRVEQVQHQTELASLKESAAAYQKAAGLEQKVAAHMEEVTSHPIASTQSSAKRGRSAEVEQVVALLRKPQTARQAVVASLILGTPKALES